ncbi:hypothetical protein FACS1894179_02550 [Bacteroidia bacterium]|nr:hypothetical protein FACS1894169_02730 [Bacteroidia bacterium]GHV38717.1 hypothetical protein FACS1894179_02550 [Bacteroidia bacterium]
MKLYKYLVIISVAIFSTIGFTSCEKKYYEVGANIESFIFEVDYDHWEWNTSANRYEYSFSFPEFDNYMFDQGSVDGAVYIWKTVGATDYQVLTPLPYQQSYYDGSIMYSETIGMDLHLEPVKKVVFYIQRNDLTAESRFLDDYKFKVVFTYRQ